MKENVTIRLSAFADEAAADLNGQIAALKRNGIPFTELRSIQGKNIGDFTFSEAKEYAATLSGEGIGVWALGSPLGKTDINTNFKEYVNLVKHVCELANCFHTQFVRVFSFYNAYGERNRVFDYLAQMVEVAGAYNVTLCHENEKEIYGDTVGRILDLKEHVSGLKFVYDPANFIQTGEDSGEALNALHGAVEYFHIKDVVVETGELVPAGFGNGKIDELIRRIDTPRTLTLEPHLALFEGYAAIDDTPMKNKYRYRSNGEAFDAAAGALKELLARAGYTRTEGGYVKL